MADEQDTRSLKDLQLRVEKLESMLERIGVTRQQQPTSVTDEEVAAFRKVRDVVAADFGGFRPINACFACAPCVVRCFTFTCLCPCGPGYTPPYGPCTRGSATASSLRRFSGLGSGTN
jgi:hypothetical protein